MRRILLCALLLFSLSGWSAITERYVTAAAPGGGDGSSGSPWTLTEAFANAVAGDRINIASGTYTRTGSDTITSSGSATLPMIYRGYNSTIGDLSTVGRPGNSRPLTTTNFPVIAYNSTYSLTLKNYTQIENLVITTNVAGNGLITGTNDVFYRIYLDNASTNSSARSISFAGDYCIIVDCDLYSTGGSGYAVSIAANFGLVYGSYILSAGGGISVGTFLGASIIRNLFLTSALAVNYASSNVTQVGLTLDNTIYGGSGIQLADIAYTRFWIFGNNHITDTVYGIRHLNANGSPYILFNNRTRDITTAALTLNSDWDNANNWNYITTDTGDETTDYVSPIDEPTDYNLLNSAAGAWAGLPGYRDIGSFQHIVNTATPTNTPTVTPTPTNTPTPTATFTPCAGGSGGYIPGVELYGR